MNRITDWVTCVDVNDEQVEIHRCPICAGLFGADATFVDQVSVTVTCPMCKVKIDVAEEVTGRG